MFRCYFGNVTNFVAEIVIHMQCNDLRSRKYAMDEDQPKRLIEATRESNLDVIWVQMIATGLRRGEALGLRWSEFDGKFITRSNQPTQT